MLDFQTDVRNRPVWREVPEASLDLMAQAAPRAGLGSEQVVADMLQHVVPYPSGHAHPRFWGWVCGTGTPIGMVADMLAAGVNASSGAFNDAPSRIEAQLIGWMRDLFDFPETTSGIVTSGGSVANMIGLAVGRDAIIGEPLRQRGLTGLSGTPVVYTSDQVHSSVDKAMMLLGLGTDNLRKVGTDDQYRIDLDALRAAIEADRRRGLRPLAIVGNAGTVNTGALDDLTGLAEIARHEGLWFHVDGAIGAIAAMSPKIRKKLRGMERADSLAFDFHKWLYVPYEAGCVLIRNSKLHRQSFSVAATYLETPPRGIAAQPDSTYLRGPQLSRGFKALKVWAQIREYGMDALGRIQEQNVAQVQYLSQLIQAEPRLEQSAPSPLNILCFRYLPEHLGADQTDAINYELLMRLQERGIAAPSSTRLNGQFVLRVANTNHRTRFEDFALLVAETVRLGREIEAGL
nr:pyridoxal-dependent decarboxylase [Acanthopleuribacter pedis]